MKTFGYADKLGDTTSVVLLRRAYADGSLAVRVSREKDEHWEPYAQPFRHLR